jgi:pantoate--beta-alanine ligase
VVTKLLSLVQPDIAWFGQKDFQQAAVVRQLAQDLNLPGKLVVHPTVRESDGLALSSRNVYLSVHERKTAPVLYRALQAGAAAIRGGERRGLHIQRLMARTVTAERSVTPEYLAVCDPSTLQPLQTVQRHAILLGAIRLGAVRLLDNMPVTIRPQS